MDPASKLHLKQDKLIHHVRSRRSNILVTLECYQNQSVEIMWLNYMFWEHQEALFVGYAQSNVACILSYTDPRALLKSDAHIRVAFEQNNKQALETRVLKTFCFINLYLNFLVD